MAPWLATLLVLVAAFSAHAAPRFRKQITIDNTRVSGSADLANFPVLISIVDPDLRTTIDGGYVENANGFDITFRDATDVIDLDFELEQYTSEPSNGTLVAWLRIPVLDYNDDTILYMHYGDPAIGASQENVNAVWNADYLGVWHIHDDFDDSTGNNNGANNGSTNATGEIADGQDFDGTAGWIDAKSDQLKNEDNFTISLWFNADTTAFARHLLWEGDRGAAGDGWGESDNSSQEMHISLGDYPAGNPPGVSSDDRLSFFLGDIDETRDTDVLGLNTSFTDTAGFHYAVVTVSDLSTSPSAEMFLNGTSVDTDVGTTARTDRNDWDTKLRLGRPGAATNYFDGVLDEARISRTTLSADWIQTDYNSQKWPDKDDFPATGFFTVGAQTLTTQTNYRSIGTNTGILYSTGTASVGVGSYTVTFGGPASLPPPTAVGAVGTGDVLTFRPGQPTEETLYILERVSATEVTLQTPATINHPPDLTRSPVRTTRSWAGRRASKPTWSRPT